MRTYQRCYEHAFATDGVYCAHDSVYRGNGKMYAKGQRAQLRNVRYRSWENFYEWYYHKGWEMQPIPGTEGETVYHEVQPDSRGKMEFRKDAEWVQLPEASLTQVQEKELIYTVYLSDNDRRMSWRAFYALPASAACFAVEAPFNIVSTSLFLLSNLIGAAF